MTIIVDLMRMEIGITVFQDDVRDCRRENKEIGCVVVSMICNEEMNHRKHFKNTYT